MASRAANDDNDGIAEIDRANDHNVQASTHNHVAGQELYTQNQKVVSFISLQYFLVTLAIGASMTFAMSSYVYNDCNGSLLMPVDPAPTNSSNCKDAELLEDYLDVYMSILLIIAVIGFIVCTVYHNKIICGGNRANTSSSPEIPYLLGGTILFGIGAIVWFILRIIDNTERGNSFVAGEIYAGLEIAFILWQFYFVFTVSDVAVKGYLFLSIFVMHVVATNCCLWIRITVGEAQERQNKLTITCQQTVFANVCVTLNYTHNNSHNMHYFDSSSNTQSFEEKVRHIADSAMPFLYPCIAEFCLSASGLLLTMWLNRQTRSADETGDRDDANTNGNSDADENADSDADRDARRENQHLLSSSYRRHRKRRCSHLCRSTTVFTIILFCITLVAMILHIVFDYKQYNPPYTQPTVLYQCSQIVVLSTAIVTALLGLVSNYSTNNDDPREIQETDNRNHHMFVEGALLFISLAGLYFAQFLQLNASLNSRYTKERLHVLEKHSCQAMLNLSSAQSFLTAFLATFQTMFIMQSLTMKQRRNVPTNENNHHYITHEDRKGSAALVLFVCNFTLWMSKTYEMSGLYCNPLYSDFFSSWVELSDVFYPLWIFYHFHSAASCVNIAWNSFNQ